MKKHIIITIFAIISLTILVQSGIINDLVIFLLVGVVPGTSFALSPTAMLVIVAAATWLVLFRAAGIDLFTQYGKSQSSKKHHSHKKRMPRRRFSEI